MPNGSIRPPWPIVRPSSGEQLHHTLTALRPYALNAADPTESRHRICRGLFGTPPPGDEAGALALYRVVQETLANVVRDSGARHGLVDMRDPVGA